MDISALKQQTFALLTALAAGAEPADVFHEDATLVAPFPWGPRTGLAAITDVWGAVRRALPDMERRDLIFVGGDNRDDPRISDTRAPHMVATLGHFQGVFEDDLLDIPATHKVVHLRYAEAHWLDKNKLRWSYLWLDLPDLMRQAGVWPLPPSFGTEGMWPGPAPQNGLRLSSDSWSGTDALDTVFGMHDALGSFDGKTLASMDHAHFWTERFMYYAGAGIGTARGMEGFRAHHQVPFLEAFPDRRGTGHFIRISDGPFAVTGGTVTGTHRGVWLGMTPTGRNIRIPVMDFYRLEGDRIAENWLPIDVPDIAHQMGNDLFARVRHLRGKHRTDLAL